jgi:hypothetical protein
MSTKCLVEVPKQIYELLRPRKLSDVTFDDINGVLLDAFISLVHEIKLYVTTNDPTTSAPTTFTFRLSTVLFHHKAVKSNWQRTNADTTRAGRSCPESRTIELYHSSRNYQPCQLQPQSSNPYPTSFPSHLVDVLVAMFWDVVVLDVSSSQLKATKINLIRFALAQGILLYPTTLSSESTPAEGPVKQMKFPEESKLFSILMEKLNQSNFTEALSLTIAIFSSPWRSQGRTCHSDTISKNLVDLSGLNSAKSTDVIGDETSQDTTTTSTTTISPTPPPQTAPTTPPQPTSSAPISHLTTNPTPSPPMPFNCNDI